MNRSAQLMQSAQDATGLTDFGSDSFREGLDILLWSLEHEARLSVQGAAALDAQIVAVLSQRLQVLHWYEIRPEIEDQEITAPLIGLGLPRTGSTALGCLLGEDPKARSLRNWEASAPCPPPTTATERNDPRIAASAAVLAQRNALFPRMRAMLPGGATSPTECQLLMAHDFKSQIFQAFAKVPTYSEWLNNKADLIPTYRHVKRVLKLLQWQCPPRRWRLKNPSHILFIDALDAVFPDARYWMTHRDIVNVVTSSSDLYFEIGRGFSDEIDKNYLGKINADSWEIGMHRLIAFRDAGHDSRFFDIHFTPFQKDPIAVIEGLYTFLGEELTEETRERMQRWRRETPREKYGEHDYDATDFGLDPEELRKRFQFYTKRFDMLPAFRAA